MKKLLAVHMLLPCFAKLMELQQLNPTEYPRINIVNIKN